MTDAAAIDDDTTATEVDDTTEAVDTTAEPTDVATREAAEADTDAVLDRLLPPRGHPVGRLLRVSRPRFWLYLAGPVLVGAAYGADAPADLFSPRVAVLFAYFLLPANVLVYGVNDLFDAEADTENPKKEGRETRYGGGRLVPAAVAVAGLAGLALAPALPRIAWAPLAGFLALAVGYSAPPVRFKTTPPLDSVSNGLYVLPGVAAYAALAGTYPPAAAVIGGWLWTMGMHTFSAVPDIGPDRRAGIKTTATALGRRGALAYCLACWLAAALSFLAVDPLLAVPLAVYPALAAALLWREADLGRVYWRFPPLNALVGAALTLGGLWVLYG